jgi:hypothetical protein
MQWFSYGLIKFKAEFMLKLTLDTAHNWPVRNIIYRICWL